MQAHELRPQTQACVLWTQSRLACLQDCSVHRHRKLPPLLWPHRRQLLHPIPKPWRLPRRMAIRFPVALILSLHTISVRMEPHPIVPFQPYRGGAGGVMTRVCRTLAGSSGQRGEARAVAEQVRQQQRHGLRKRLARGLWHVRQVITCTCTKVIG